jgi:predicted transposase YdaD
LERFPTFTREEIMVIAGILSKDLRHTRAAQQWIEEGRQEGVAQGEARGRAAEAAAVTMRLLNCSSGPLSEATTARIQALPLEQLEGLAVGAAFSEGVALLDFTGPAELAAWREAHKG